MFEDTGVRKHAPNVGTNDARPLSLGLTDNEGVGVYRELTRCDTPPGRLLDTAQEEYPIGERNGSPLENRRSVVRLGCKSDGGKNRFRGKCHGIYTVVAYSVSTVVCSETSLLPVSVEARPDSSSVAQLGQ